MDNIVRVISEDGSVICCAIDSTQIAAEAERIHQTSATATAAIGRLLTASSLMGYMLKNTEDSVTLRLSGNGPIGALIAVGNGRGNVKGYVTNPIVEIPLNQYGKLDVAGAVGRDGFLSVIKDVGQKEPSTGHSQIVSGEIAEDITYYYAMSEQIPTVCALGVLVNTDLTVISAGGFIVQLLPGADDTLITKLEENINKLKPISTLVKEGLSPEQIAFSVLDGLAPQVLDSGVSKYLCDCSRDRVKRALASLGKEEIERLVSEQEVTQVECHFCNKKEQFSGDELKELIN